MVEFPLFHSMSHIGKRPNTRCSHYAVPNGHNPAGVRDCAFIIRLLRSPICFYRASRLKKHWIKAFISPFKKTTRINLVKTFKALIKRICSLKIDLLIRIFSKFVFSRYRLQFVGRVPPYFTALGYKATNRCPGILWIIPGHIAHKRLFLFLRRAGPNPTPTPLGQKSWGELERTRVRSARVPIHFVRITQSWTVVIRVACVIVYF